MKCKKILCIWMAAVLVFPALPGLTVSAREIQMQEAGAKAAGTTADGYSYEERNDGTLSITGYSGSSTELVIPSEIDGKSVTRIDGEAFADCESLTSVKLPGGVARIGAEAFIDCENLASITIPESMASIESRAFYHCKKLKDIYYGGSREQWEGIAVCWGDGENDYLRSATVHYNSDGPAEPSGQTITAKNITKTYGAKPFPLNAKVDTGTALTYAVSDRKVATVDKKGKVTIKGCGITNITITAPKTDAYSKAQKTIKLTVKPKKVTLSSVKSTKKKTATVKWKQDKKAIGYLIQCATDGKFKKNKVQVTVSKNKTVSATVKKLKPGKKYYVRVCAYAGSGKTKVQGDWSRAKTVKVKK